MRAILSLSFLDILFSVEPRNSNGSGYLDDDETVRSHKFRLLASTLLLRAWISMTRSSGRPATSEYSKRYPRRTFCKGLPRRSRHAALPAHCPASGRGETEAAAQCRIRR